MKFLRSAKSKAIKHKGHEGHKGKTFVLYYFVYSPALQQTQCGASVVSFVFKSFLFKFFWISACPS